MSARPDTHVIVVEASATGDGVSATHHSPIGPLTLASNGSALIQLEFANGKYPLLQFPSGTDAVLDQARHQLDEYFARRLRVFTVPVAPRGTEFQGRVWDALRAIPYGDTRSYAQQARAIGAPSATRAVGAANGRNPIPIIIPCHRVIGSDGALTGFGGGIERKQFLLALER